MNIIEKEDVIAVIKSFMDINAGNEASEDLILAIGAKLLDVSSDAMNKMVFDDNNSGPKSAVKVLGATLLSREEAEELLTKEERFYENWWWLRSPGYYSFDTCYVNFGGYVYDDCYTNYAGGGVRPALKINISSSDVKVGDVFMFGGKEFKIISPELAWMHNDDIGTCAFREKRDAPDANVYEVSDVKNYVDAWFHKTKTGRA